MMFLFPPTKQNLGNGKTEYGSERASEGRLEIVLKFEVLELNP